MALEAPPAGLRAELTHDGFHCELLPGTDSGSRLVASAAEASLMWFVLFGVAIGVTGALVALASPIWVLPTTLLTGVKVLVVTVSVLGLGLALERGLLRRSVRVQVDHDQLTLTSRLVGRPVHTQAFKLESIRSAEVREGPPNELVLRLKSGETVVKTRQPLAQLQWVAAAISHARERKADFWREVLAPERGRDRDALGRLTSRQ